jgi:hypothetical protein
LRFRLAGLDEIKVRGVGGGVVDGKVAVFEGIAVGGLGTAAADSRERGVRGWGYSIQHGELGWCKK